MSICCLHHASDTSLHHYPFLHLGIQGGLQGLRLCLPMLVGMSAPEPNQAVRGHRGCSKAGGSSPLGEENRMGRALEPLCKGRENQGERVSIKLSPGLMGQEVMGDLWGEKLLRFTAAEKHMSSLSDQFLHIRNIPAETQPSGTACCIHGPGSEGQMTLITRILFLPISGKGRPWIPFLKFETGHFICPFFIQF